MAESNLDLFFDHPEQIGREIGFRDLTPLHGQWIKEMVFGADDYTLQAHRGSYKSSCLAVAISILLVYYPDRNIIFLRKTDSDVSEMLGMVSKILKSDAFRKLYKGLENKNLTVTSEGAFPAEVTFWYSAASIRQTTFVPSSVYSSDSTWPLSCAIESAAPSA